MIKGIKSWPESERPRERLLQFGVAALSDAELVAILLRNGTRDKNVMTLAREILVHFGGLRGLFSLGWRELQGFKGLGPAKTSTFLAVAELAKRQLKEEILGKNIVRDPESVIAYLYASLRDKKKEVFKVFFLNRANRILDEKDLFEGTVDEAVVHPREVVKAALEYHATGLILVHNLC